MGAVCSGCSRIMVYGGGDIVFDTKRSKQWMQYAVCSGIVVYGCGDIVKGQTSGFSGCSYTIDTVHSGHSTQYAVHSGCSGIVVYGGGDIVFDTKRSNQWMQWMQYAVHSGHSRIVVYGGGDIVFGAKG